MRFKIAITKVCPATLIVATLKDIGMKRIKVEGERVTFQAKNELEARHAAKYVAFVCKDPGIQAS